MALAEILRLLMASPYSAPPGAPPLAPLPKAASNASVTGVPGAKIPGPFDQMTAMTSAASAFNQNQYRDAQTELLKRQLDMQKDFYNKANQLLLGGGEGALSGTAVPAVQAATAPTAADGTPGSTPPVQDGMRAGGALDFPALRSLAEQAGFKGDAADTMAATSLAESSGNPFAIGDKDIGGSFGITQINKKAHGPVAEEAYGNAPRAMQLAYEISKGGTDFTPWTMFKNGGYKKYLPSGGSAEPTAAPQAAGESAASMPFAPSPSDVFRQQTRMPPVPAQAPAGSGMASGMPATPQQFNLTPAQRQILALSIMGKTAGLGDIAAPLSQAYYGSPEYLTAKSAAEARGQYAGPGADPALQGRLKGAEAAAVYPYDIGKIQTTQELERSREQERLRLQNALDLASAGPKAGAAAEATLPFDIRKMLAGEGYQVAQTSDGSMRLEPIPGSKAAQAQAEQQLGQRQAADVVTQDIDRALKLSGGWTTGIGGSVFQGIPGTAAHDLAATLQTVKSNVGLERLQQMRMQSPTGGALGQITEGEHKILQSVLGNLDQSQTQGQFEENLRRLRDQYHNIIYGEPGKLGQMLKEGKINKDQYDAAMNGRTAFEAPMRPIDDGTRSAAQAAIQKGADRGAVIKRLRDGGFDTRGF